MDNEHTPLTVAHACQDAADVLLAFSIPLYLLANDRPWLCGTGFIVKSLAGHFLVTAAHVLDDAKENGLFFYSGQRKPRPIRGPLLRSSAKANRAHDPFDIAVVNLIDGAMPPYGDVEKHAVDISWLRAMHLPRAGKMFSIIGFPQSKSNVRPSTREVKVTSSAYRDRSIDEDDYAKFGLNPRTHLALHLDRKVGFDPDGKHRNFPKPQGMSGAPIIELYDVNVSSAADIFPVVAVGIEYREKDHLLVGTDIAVALDMIHKLSNPALQADAPQAARH